MESSSLQPLFASCVAFLLILLGGVPNVSGFELVTHAALTREAFLQSMLNPGTPAQPRPTDLLERLGLEVRNANLGTFYFDIASTTSNLRSAFPERFESFAIDKIDDANLISSFTPQIPSLPAWLMLGAVREDDVPYDVGEVENSPDDDPQGAFVRVLHHFHDPYHDAPLTVDEIVPGTRARDWATRGSPGRDGRENSFSTLKAREAMWRALTLKDAPQGASDGTLSDVAFLPSAELGTREAMRVAYWATTFRGLGDVVHLAQDMAQPQHTRNDSHSGLGCAGRNCAGGHKSYFEAYVEGRVKGATSFTLRERFYSTYGITDRVENIKLGVPTLSGYAPTRFDRYDRYFSSGPGPQSLTGTGLADYSSRGFFSAGTLPGAIADPVYQFPSPSIGLLTPALVTGSNLVNAAGALLDRGSLQLLNGPVTDTFRPEASEGAIRLLSQGAFDQFLKPTSKSGYSLNHYNYAEQARLLLPRAVAYSAGLLDYFFRGKLEIALPDEGVYAVRDNSAAICKDACGFELVKVKLTNDTPGEAMGPGVVVAVVKFHRNNCYRTDLTGEPGGPNFTGGSCRNAEEEIVVSSARAVASMATGTTQSFAFDFKQRPIPINATDITLQVAFRGKLGNEDDAVAVTTRNIAEPSYLALENATDYRYNTATDTYAPSGAPSAFTSAKVMFGNAAVPLATLPGLPAPGHAQLAFLGDLATSPVKIDVTAPQLSLSGALTVGLPSFVFYLPPGTGTTYTSNWHVSPVRGVYRRFVYSISRSANYEVYLCSLDFNPLACTEATLPPLTSASAAPWTIDFK